MNFVYVGSRTTAERGGHGKGIAVYKIDLKGKWELIQTVEQVNPSFLCLDHTGQYLYAIHGDYNSISSYVVSDDGRLTFLSEANCGGTNPVHLSVDRSNRWVFVANLQTGSIGVLPREEDGTVKELKHLYFVPGNGGPGYISHPHQVNQTPDGEYLIVSCQGRLQGVGQVIVYKIDHESGELTKVQAVYARPGAEPRHCVFTPDGNTCYGVNEKDFTVTQYSFQEGRLSAQRIVQTLFEEQIEEGWSSGIAMEPAGKFLYVSDRKQHLVSCFCLNEDGRPCLSQTIDTKGRQPRFIAVSPDGKHLLAANELSDSIYEFPINMKTGCLEEGILRAETGSPVCIVWRNTDI